MQGIAVGRAVDLTLVEDYDDLITELEKMFEIKGELKERKKWQVVYTDEEGDMCWNSGMKTQRIIRK